MRRELMEIKAFKLFTLVVINVRQLLRECAGRIHAAIKK